MANSKPRRFILFTFILILWSAYSGTRHRSTLIAEAQGSSIIPPAIFYGQLIPKGDFLPQVGMNVNAFINGNLCGSSQVFLNGADLAYLIEVEAETPFEPSNNCGATGLIVTFEIDDWKMDHDAQWKSEQANFHPMTNIRVLGDVSCDSNVNTVDALFILQQNVGLRFDSAMCPLSNPVTELNIGNCDVNNDLACSTVDALFILQCNVGAPNQFCPINMVLLQQPSLVLD